MKRIILALLAAVTMFTLSGCGDDNTIVAVPPPSATSANITFASVSSAQGAPGAWSNGLGYVNLNAALPGYANISTTTAAGPTTGKTGAPAFPALPAGAKRISASALVKAGSFANISSVSKRTKITGFFTTSATQPIKNIQIFMVYSTPAVAPIAVRAGDFASLSTSVPVGQPLTADIIKNMNEAIWTSVLFFTLDAAQTFVPLNATPTISSVVLGF